MAGRNAIRKVFLASKEVKTEEFPVTPVESISSFEVT
jgi:hypothetical protein